MDTLLRYPGGKVKSAKHIAMYMNDEYDEYREPLCGGAAMFFYLKENFKNIKHYWINDIRDDLISFWMSVRDYPDDLIKEIYRIKNGYDIHHGKDLYLFLKSNEKEFDSLIYQSARFYIMNRITFSGVMDAGSYSDTAYRQRFTDTSIQKIKKTSTSLQGVKITCGNFAPVISDISVNSKTLIYLDPPYYGNSVSKLYGKNGKLHTGFDHIRLNELLKECANDSTWFLSYDDHPYIKDIYSNYFFYAINMNYGINHRDKNEIIITNKKTDS